MGHVICKEKEPDLYAIWSTIVDDWLLRNATWNDIVHHEMVEAIRDAIDNESRVLRRVEAMGSKAGDGMMTSNIEWADFNISPYPGCLHNCSWCYAAAMTKRWWETWQVDKDFKPTWKPERLPQLTSVKGVVFVNGMGDLFGKWVEDARLNEVLVAVKANPFKPTFVFLTKNPARYLDVLKDNPSLRDRTNIWLGATLELGNEDGNAPKMIFRIAAMAALDYPRKLISFEPMDPEQHALATSLISEIEPQWVMVGTEKLYTYQPVPDTARLQDVVQHCQSLHVPIFVKDRVFEQSGVHDWPRQFPAGVALATKDAAWHPKVVKARKPAMKIKPLF